MGFGTQEEMSLARRFTRHLRNAVCIARERGELSREQADLLYDAIVRPGRRSTDGETCNLVARIHDECCRLVECDVAVPRAVRVAVRSVAFDWEGIRSWFRDHWPQLLQFLMSLLSVFIMFV